ncbi:MAG: hypothetical protein HETSPECPRED_008521 [Heterodermia speciosa]|uniref:LysM domain-containing protein n=1 Tax=Heterodermia speciosa TaxID=116794 RepID=A0A8H3IXY6_9LECA|nr:MAG: hypothetical protein HETSPECPRED_008521 [Heterodermia speciosa]
MPLVVIPDIMRYLYNLTCLMDTGRYCNTVAAKAAFAEDPGSMEPSPWPSLILFPHFWDDGGDAVTGISIGDGSSTASVAPVNQCDLCFIKNLRFRAGSPYYDGPLLIASSLYQSKTTSCSITGYPLTTSVLSYATPSLTSTPISNACSGKTYAIQGGDDCYSISKLQGIGTGWLLYDNNLQAYCSEFPKTGNLCLINTCKIYSVREHDTCASIAAAQNVTVPQIVGWNPVSILFFAESIRVLISLSQVLDASCYNMDKMNGSQICISAPGKPYVTPTISLVAPTIATTPAPVPTDVADGVNPRCGQYYHVVTGDYCNMIVIKFKITMADFVFLNPSINANCTNLFADESYCVQAVGDIDTYSGRVGYSTPAPTQGPITAHYADLPDATYASSTSTATPTPYADGTRTDCNNYFNGDIFQGSIAGTNWNSKCELAANSYDVDLSDFGTWNTGLGNVTSPGCSFTAGVQYCGKLYFGDAPDSSKAGPDLPIRDGASPNCTEYADIEDGWTCADILDIYHLTIAQFFSYNSAVKADCSGLWLGYQYCIRAPGYSDPAASTTTSGVGNPAPTPTSPVQSGQPSDCNKWYTIKSGDSCTSVEQLYFITHAQFRAWNPSVSEDCSTGFWLGYDYCVSIVTMTTTRSSINPAPTSTKSAVPVPTPNQAGNAISNCNKYAQTQSGDYCSLFATRNGITSTNLYAWNSVLGSDGSGCDTNFWLGYYYCVGVS